jgi:hypothetical protein
VEQFGRLFVCLGEELKLPLQQIARQAELQRESRDDIEEPMRHIQTSADMSLQLLDSYLMSLRFGFMSEAKLELAPVSVAAVLHETADRLRVIAQQYGVEVELHIDGKYEPVMAHRHGLMSALLALGYALIEALPAAEPSRLRLEFAAHRTKYGIVAGMYGELNHLTPQAFRRSKALAGQAAQPLTGSLPGSGAGVFVADALLAAMESHLRVGRFHKLPGFAVTLPPSQQLQLV